MNTAPHPLTLAGKLCSMGSIGPDDLAAITPDTPRITVLLEDGQAVHLVGLTREHIQGMAPMFFEPVRIVVQPAEDMPEGQQYDGRYGGVAGAAEAAEELAEKVQDLQRENALLRQQISATIPADQQAAARARIEAIRPSISLPPTEALRALLFDSLDRFADVSAPVDMERELRDLDGARQLIALRKDAARVDHLDAHVSGCIRLDDPRAIAPTYLYWGAHRPEKTAREAIDAARVIPPPAPGSPA